MNINIAILLCTYNSAKFLQEQLDSYIEQDFKNWSLFVYDDCSTDSTKDLVEHYKQKHSSTNKIEFISNNTKSGFAKNFLNAICNTSKEFDFYALSDHDDIWLKKKLERAIAYFNNDNHDKNTPILYCSRTQLVTSTGQEIGYSPHFTRQPSFRNALVQSIAGGNTYVFNKAACELIKTAKIDSEIVSHDWLIYQLMTGAGGLVYYDFHSEILYRQHADNLIGSNDGMLAKLSRIAMLMSGSFRDWNNKNIAILSDNLGLLTEENKGLLSLFIKSRNAKLIPRVIGFIRGGFYRQTFLQNAALFIGVVFNKI